MNILYDPKDTINFWCKKWNISNIPELDDTKELDGIRGYISETDGNKPLLIIDRKFGVNSKNPLAINVILHELRHYYQKVVFRRVFDWWVNNEEYYFRLYGKNICVIEEDAEIFSWTCGSRNGDFLLREFNQIIAKGILNDKNKIDYALESFGRKATSLIRTEKINWKQNKENILKNTKNNFVSEYLYNN